MSDENTLTGSATPAPATAEQPAEVTTTEAQIGTEAQSSETGTEPAKSESDDAKETETKPKPKSRGQERIEQLARDRKNLLRTVSRLNQQIGQLKAERPPSEAEYADPNEYQRAMFKHATKEAALESQFETQRASMDELTAKRREAWNEVVVEARQQLPDFDQVFDANTPVSDVMADLIMESDNPSGLAYYLGKNKSEARRIAEMQPLEAARAMGRLEAKIVPPSPRHVSSAPKPVTMVSGKAHQSSSKAPHEMASNMDDYAKWWTAREGVKS